MKEKIIEFVSEKFAGYPRSPKIVALQEDVCSRMQNVYDSCLSKGISENASYNRATNIIYI